MWPRESSLQLGFCSEGRSHYSMLSRELQDPSCVSQNRLLRLLSGAELGVGWGVVGAEAGVQVGGRGSHRGVGVASAAQ